MNKKLKLTNFHLKLIALVTMLIDHIGVFIIYPFYPTSISYLLVRLIGRIALPMFAFMISEGMVYTKKPLHYLLRLAIMALAIGLALFIGQKYLGFDFIGGNIFIDLLLGALIIYTLQRQKYQKLFALIPIGITFVLYYFQPHAGIALDYSLYGVIMIVGFYLVRQLSIYHFKHNCQKAQLDFEIAKNDEIYQKQLNVYASVWLLSINLIWYIISRIDGNWVSLQMGPQSYSIFAIFFIYMYSGKRGYNKKWFTYGSYLFYPAHLLLLYGLNILIATII